MRIKSPPSFRSAFKITRYLHREYTNRDGYIKSIMGDEQVDKLPYSDKRIQEVEYHLTQNILEKYFREDDAGIEKSTAKWWLFPQLVEIVRDLDEELPSL